MLNKKSIGIIILLIAVIGGGFWYFSKEQRTASKEQSEIVKQQEVVKQDKEGLNNQTEDKTEELKIEDIDTSNWKTYRNEEMGFELKYPEGWEVKKYKAFSLMPALGPIDCEKTPEKCPFEKIQLYKLTKKSKDVNKISSLSITRLPSDYTTNYKSTVSTEWMEGLITGCSITYLFNKGKDNRFILHSFQDSNKYECQNNKYDKIFDRILAEFKMTE